MLFYSHSYTFIFMCKYIYIYNAKKYVCMYAQYIRILSGLLIIRVVPFEQQLITCPLGPQMLPLGGLVQRVNQQKYGGFRKLRYSKSSKPFDYFSTGTYKIHHFEKPSYGHIWTKATKRNLSRLAHRTSSGASQTLGFFILPLVGAASPWIRWRSQTWIRTPKQKKLGGELLFSFKHDSPRQ